MGSWLLKVFQSKENETFLFQMMMFFFLWMNRFASSRFRNPDFVLLTGKSDQIEMLAGLARQLLNVDGYVLSLSNGLGHAELCQGVLGPHRVFAATSIMVHEAISQV